MVYYQTIPILLPYNYHTDRIVDLQLRRAEFIKSDLLCSKDLDPDLINGAGGASAADNLAMGMAMGEVAGMEMSRMANQFNGNQYGTGSSY